MNTATTSPGLGHRSPFSEVAVEPLADKAPNRQLYENSPLSVDQVVEDYVTHPDRLFGTENSPPNLAIIKEKPEHRILCYLKAQGLSNRELAEKCGLTEAWVSQITRQPWFRLRLIQELRDAGIDAVRTMLRASALDSVFTLIELRDNPQAPAAVRKSSADSILDRFLGKATQKIESDSVPTAPSTPEISAIDHEIQELEAQLKLNEGAVPNEDPK